MELSLQLYGHEKWHLAKGKQHVLQTVRAKCFEKKCRKENEVSMIMGGCICNCVHVINYGSRLDDGGKSHAGASPHRTNMGSGSR
jgi:hypothetical protein